MGTCGKKSALDEEDEIPKIEQPIIEIKDNKNKGIELKESEIKESNKDITEISIIYNINKEIININIFGYKFVEKNKKISKMTKW